MRKEAERRGRRPRDVDGGGSGLSEVGFWRKWGAGEMGEVSRGLGYAKAGKDE